MGIDNSDLGSVINSIKGTPILVIGDVMLDQYIWGSVDRISPEAPVPVVSTNRIEFRLGGAGNVVRNLCNIGAKVTLCGFIGDDVEGKTVLKQLESLHVEKDGMIIDRNRPTILKTRVVAQAQQMLRIDREDSSLPSNALVEGLAAVIDSYLDKVKAIVISDYGKGSLSQLVFNRLHQALKSGRIGLGKVPVVVDPHPRNYELYKDIDVIKPNRKEAELASGIKITDRESALKAGVILQKRWSANMVLITLGEKGMMLLEKGKEKPLYLDTAAVEVYDVSGAGDAVTSVFAAAIAVGATPSTAANLSNIAGGIVVAEVGTAAVNLDKLRDEIELYSTLKSCLASRRN